MAAFTKFHAFSEAVYEKVHNFATDQLKIALTNTLPVAATADQLVDITEIAYTYCSTRNVTTSSSGHTAGVYKLVCADLTLTATGGAVGPFRYIVLYNDTATGDELVGFYDYGSSITLADTETFLIDFDGAAGVFTHT